MEMHYAKIRNKTSPCALVVRPTRCEKAERGRREGEGPRAFDTPVKVKKLKKERQRKGYTPHIYSTALESILCNKQRGRLYFLHLEISAA
jgi:hypothetical protein